MQCPLITGTAMHSVAGCWHTFIISRKCRVGRLIYLDSCFTNLKDVTAAHSIANSLIHNANVTLPGISVTDRFSHFAHSYVSKQADMCICFVYICFLLFSLGFRTDTGGLLVRQQAGSVLGEIHLESIQIQNGAKYFLFSKWNTRFKCEQFCRADVTDVNCKQYTVN